MSASSPRSLPLLLLVAALAFPSHASAAPRDFGSLLGKVGGFFSALWAPVGCVIEPSGRCGAASSPELKDHGCEIDPNGSCASGPVEGGSTLLGDHGCELDPNGRCQP